MKNDSNCREFQENFPLLFTGQLAEDDKSTLIEHVELCEDCRLLFNQERAMFGMASTSQSSNLLINHPEIELLDNYSRYPEQLGSEITQQISTHIEDCPLCEEIVDRIKSLPEILTDLVKSNEIPIIEALDREFAVAADQTTKSKVVRLAPRDWLRGLAAAAVVVLVGILLIPRKDELSVITARFPVATRSVSTTQIIETPNDMSELHGSVFVDPEDDHIYNIAIENSETDSTIALFEHTMKLDEKGFAHFELPIVPGTYRLILYDIENDDTLETPYTFEVQLKK